MKVKFTSIAPLHYRGKTYKTGDILEITEGFYNSHHSRFEIIDNNYVMDAEFKEIRNIAPEKKAKKGPKK